MLVLKRRPDESIWIGGRVRITIVRIGRDSVQLGVEAPKEVRILREELLPVLPTVDASDQPSPASDGA